MLEESNVVLIRSGIEVVHLDIAEDKIIHDDLHKGETYIYKESLLKIFFLYLELNP